MGSISHSSAGFSGGFLKKRTFFNPVKSIGGSFDPGTHPCSGVRQGPRSRMCRISDVLNRGLSKQLEGSPQQQGLSHLSGSLCQNRLPFSSSVLFCQDDQKSAWHCPRTPDRKPRESASISSLRKRERACRTIRPAMKKSLHRTVRGVHVRQGAGSRSLLKPTNRL